MYQLLIDHCEFIQNAAHACCGIPQLHIPRLIPSVLNIGTTAPGMFTYSSYHPACMFIPRWLHNSYVLAMPITTTLHVLTPGLQWEGTLSHEVQHVANPISCNLKAPSEIRFYPSLVEI